MIGLEITGSEQVIAKLGEMTGKIRIAASSSLDKWATELAGYIKSEKLSGQVLKRQTGHLSQSVRPVTTSEFSTTTTISAGSMAGDGVKYAKIHEYGGLIPAHVVVVRNAKALAFSVGGVTRFAKSVQIPDVQMPERSYMRSSLREEAPQGIEALKQAVREAIV
jgi:phage gpG-like protein